MTDTTTPRTDELVQKHSMGLAGLPGHVVARDIALTDLARELERELAAACEAINLAVATEGETEKQEILRAAQDRFTPPAE